jgi:hypothetical protein
VTVTSSSKRTHIVLKLIFNVKSRVTTGGSLVLMKTGMSLAAESGRRGAGDIVKCQNLSVFTG